MQLSLHKSNSCDLQALGGFLSNCKFLDLGRRDEGFERNWEVWCSDLTAQAERLRAGRGWRSCSSFSKGSICLLRADDDYSGYSGTEMLLIRQVRRVYQLDVLLEQSKCWFDLRQQDHSSHWAICQLRILHFLSGFTPLDAFSFSCALNRNCFLADRPVMAGEAFMRGQCVPETLLANHGSKPALPVTKEVVRNLLTSRFAHMAASYCVREASPAHRFSCRAASRWLCRDPGACIVGGGCDGKYVVG